MTEKKGRNRLRYYGWSTVLIESEDAGSLVFDPFYSSDYETYWADLRDFHAVKVICLSHGHHEHYTDAHKVASRTGASIVAHPVLCRHLSKHFRVPREQLLPINQGETITVCGYEITSFPWYHRKINYFKFFAGKFLTGLRFVLSNLLHTPLNTPFSAFVVKTPEGLTLMNMAEGMNDTMPVKEVTDVARQFKPGVVIGGWQLHYEDSVARCVKASGAVKCVLYHPHEKLFELMKLASTPLSAVCAKVRQSAPDVEILTPAARQSITL